MKIYSQIFIIILITLMTAGICYSAGSNILTVQAVILSKSNCRFNAATSTLNFGALDPSNPVDVTATTTVSIICHGSANPATFDITGNGGLYGNRIRNTTVTSEFIPYILNSVSGTVAKNANTNITLSGKVLGGSYRNAYMGNYSDSVVITISP